MQKTSRIILASILLAHGASLVTQAATYALDNNAVLYPLNASDGTEPRDNWFGNVFTAQADGNVITRVDFGVFTTTPNSAASVVIYGVTDPGGNPALGATRLHTQSFTPLTGDGATPFLQQIPLTTPVKITPGDRFVVAVFIPNVIGAPPNDVYPFLLDTSGVATDTYWDRSNPNSFNLDDLSQARLINQGFVAGGFIPDAGHVVIRAVGVAENTAPVALCTNVVVAAGANCEADASVDNGSLDPDGDPITISQVPPGPYSLGSHPVTLIVTDSKGASNSCNALVTVVDATPPTIACPAPITVEFQDEHGAVVSFVVTASDTCSSVNLTVTPASGSVFPIGDTPVQAVATDAAGNSSGCASTVTVLGAQGVKSNVLAELVALRTSTTLPQSFAVKFDYAILNLHNSLNPDYWIDQTHLQPKYGNAAMNEEKLAAKELGVIMDSKKCPVDPAILEGFIDRILKSDRLLAIISIDEASLAGLDARKIAEALVTVTLGDEAAAAGHYANAVEHYRNAWRHVLHLRPQASGSKEGASPEGILGNNRKPSAIQLSPE